MGAVRHRFDPTAPARCVPRAQPCRQHCQCARSDPNPHAAVIDATTYMHRTGEFCPMFIDRRGLALLRV